MTRVKKKANVSQKIIENIIKKQAHSCKGNRERRGVANNELIAD